MCWAWHPIYTLLIYSKCKSTNKFRSYQYVMQHMKRSHNAGSNKKCFFSYLQYL